MDTTSTLDSAGTIEGIIVLMTVVLLFGAVHDRIERGFCAAAHATGTRVDLDPFAGRNG